MTIPRNRLAVARCACGRPYSEPAWQSLPWCGDQVDGCPDGTRLELRSCVCGSHIARPCRGDEYLDDEQYERLEAEADGVVT